MTNVIPFICILLLFSCSGNKQKENIQEENRSISGQLIGTWTNTYMKVDMHTFNNSDSTKVLEVNENNWEEKMKIQVIRTFFRANGTYNSEHRNLKDSIVYNPAGNWSIVNDSLLMTDTFPQAGLSYKFKLAIKDSTAEFWGLEDFDQDGKKDDAYYGKQNKN